MKASLVIVTALLLGAANMNAQTNKPAADESYFGKGLSLSGFGVYTRSEPQGFDHVFDSQFANGDFGVGVGADYFFTEYIGVGADATINNLDEVKGSFLDSASVSGILRYPLGRFAPYALGGLTRNFETDRWDLHAGVGLEVKLDKTFSGFTEARYLFETPKFGDNLQVRAGIKVKL